MTATSSAARHDHASEQDDQPDRPAPGPDTSSQEHRKQQVLTKGRATVVGSIADAVVAKDGEPFFLCQPDGQVPLDPGHGYGFYHHDCRFLRGYVLRVAGRAPEGLAASETEGSTLVIELTNAGVIDGHSHVGKEQLGVTWTRRVDADGPALHDTLDIRNYGGTDAEVPVELEFAATFEDLFVIRGLLDEEPGANHDPAWHDRGPVFRYDGGDGIQRLVRVSIDPTPDSHSDHGGSLTVKVPARGTTRVSVDVALEEHARPGVSPIERRESPRGRPAENQGTRQSTRHTKDEGGDWIGGHGWPTSVRTSSFALRAALGRSLDDLVQLRGELDGLRYYEAGVPWFATLFGRDSLISAYQSLAFDPDIAAETLRLLAKRQGTKVDEWRDEQPGKILHELRIGELARMGEIPQTPYYGTVDATPLFLVVLARHAAWTGSLDLFHELRHAVDAALGWLDTYADSDGDGFVDYRSTTRRGLVNQGWKDSGDGIIDAKGRIATPPIALAEVQGYAWRAWQEIAALLDRDGDRERAGELRGKADAIRTTFESRFWSDDLGCYVLAIGDGRPCDVVTSNAGQVLWTGIASRDHAERVAARLMRDDMYNGWGIRTLSSDAVAYHPVGYHLGTVWPHDNSLIAEGFRRYDCDDQAERVFLGLLEAAQRFPHDRLPECFAGFDRAQFGIPVRYPVACHPQAWAAGAIPSLLVSVLGIEPDAPNGRVLVRRPRLPQGIESVEIRDLPVGRGAIHLKFDRSDHETTVEVLDASGGLRVDVDVSTPAEAGG